MPIDLSKVQLQKINLPFDTGVNLHLLRIDLIDEEVSGNKWFKLKKNIEDAFEQNKKGIITFGGAYSNHIAATAKACNSLNINCIGIIRGEEINNHTLEGAKALGMELRYISRSIYRDKTLLMQWLASEFDVEDYLVIPEGGANAAGVIGCKEIAPLINIPFDYIAVACGTGTTLAGVVQSLENNQKALGFSALKGGHFLYGNVQQAIPSSFHQSFTILEDYHFGGYAKYTPELIQFIHSFKNTQGIKLDFIYTAKMMFGLYDLIQKNYFEEHATIIALHSGGLQGNQGIGI